MPARDPQPQGPTSEQLRARVLAHEAQATAAANGPVPAPAAAAALPPPAGCTCPAGSYDPGQAAHVPYCALWLPPGARLTTCSGPNCEAEIWRARTLLRSGKLGGNMPVDYPRLPGGNLVLDEGVHDEAHGLPIVHVATQAEKAAGAPMFMPHWVACPDAPQFREGR